MIYTQLGLEVKIVGIYGMVDVTDYYHAQETTYANLVEIEFLHTIKAWRFLDTLIADDGWNEIRAAIANDTCEEITLAPDELDQAIQEAM